MDETEEPVDPRAYLKQLTVLGLADNPRCQELHARWSFYEGSQHDHQQFTWDGESRERGVRYLQARLKPFGYNSAREVSSSAKKPDTPVPLARQIVSRFTEMLYAEGRRPQIVVPQDLATQDFLEAVYQEADLWEVYAQARDIAGGCGSAGIACGLQEGVPFSEALHPGNLWIPEWDSGKKGWVPKVVVEQIQVNLDMLDPETKKLKTVPHWRSRAWTDTEVIVYQDTPVKGWPIDKPFPIEAGYPKPHSLGRCPVFWMQNTLNAKCPDGDPDCEGTWELLDQVDREQSIVHRAIRNNTAPTVVIKDSRAELRKPREFLKGKLIEVGSDGGADYLEMNGQSIEIGLKGIDALTLQILRTVECIVLDPEQAKSYNSGESLQMLWRSMECAASRKRTTQGTSHREMQEFWVSVGSTLGIGGEDGIILPPRRIKDDKSEASGTDSWGEHSCKSGLWRDLKWPPFWTLTPKQVNELAMGYAKAVGGKDNPAFLSIATAARRFARDLGEDPDVEVQEVESQHEDQLAEQQEISEAENELEKELAKAKPVPKPAPKSPAKK